MILLVVYGCCYEAPGEVNFNIESLAAWRSQSSGLTVGKMRTRMS